MTAQRGHRQVSHTADVAVEAWGPNRIECLEELVLALVSTFARGATPGGSRSLPVEVAGTTDREVAVALLEEVVYVLDTSGAVPVGVELHDADGGVAGSFTLAPLAALETVGPAPKGISRSELRVGVDGARWRARAIVDV